MKKLLTAALCGTTAMLAAAGADAATFDYRFGFDFNGGVVAVSGKLDATETGTGTYTIDAATGLFTEEYVQADNSIKVYENGSVTGVFPTFADVGPSFTLTNGALTDFDAVFGGTNGFSDLFYQVTFSSGEGTGFFVEIGGPLTVATLTPSLPGAVPEPATWALMILGFGAVGAAMRRRRSVKATVRFA